MRNTVILKSFFLIIVCCSVNHAYWCKAQQTPNNATTNFTWPSGNNQIEFTWQGDSIQSTWEPYSAMLIPVRLKDCPVQFYMQFDLGSPYSMFYRNKLTAIAKKYPKSVEVNDTSTKLTAFSFYTDKIKILASEIQVKAFGSSIIDWKQKNKIIIIGTIGTDFIENKIAAIDYPNKKIMISDSLPSKHTNSLFDCVVTRGSILLPVTIKEKKMLLYFDTGSSAYELLTDKETTLQLSTDNSMPFEHKAPSWNQELTAYTYETNESMTIASKKIPLQHVTYIEGASEAKINQMIKLGIGGMTGNKLFLPFVLILDITHKKFGIVDSY